MILLNDFFKILKVSRLDHGLEAEIELNPVHCIYSGHFPGQPVTPGVIQLQIIEELLAWHLGSKLKLHQMRESKFLNILNPLESPIVSIQIEYALNGDLLTLKAFGKNDKTLFFKLNATYRTN